MAYESNLTAVIAALDMSKLEALEIIGTTCTASVQLIEPVKTGNMRRATTHQIVGNSEVDVGVTKEASYAVYADQGTSKQPAQHFLENGITQGVSQSLEPIGNAYAAHMGR